MSSSTVQNEHNKGALPLLFKKGIAGLEELHHYNLQALPDNPLFYHLLSTENQTMGFILLDPFPVFPDYSVTLSDGEIAALAVESKDDLLVLTTVNISGEKGLTTNLAAPIVVNLRNNTAMQLIIPEKIRELRTPLPQA